MGEIDQFLLTSDSWLSRIMERECFNVTLSREPVISSSDGSSSLERLADTQHAFATAKIAPERTDLIAELEDKQFRLVDTNVVFEKRIIAQPYTEQLPPTLDRQVRLACSTDRERVVEIAGQSFSSSRFHLDPRIPDALANKIKAGWSDEFFNGNRGQAMLLYINQETENVEGYVQLLHSGDDAVVIDLIAVTPEARKKGVASALMLGVERYASKRKLVRVGTQLANAPSIALYQRVGYKLISANYVFHYHKF